MFLSAVIAQNYEPLYSSGPGASFQHLTFFGFDFWLTSEHFFGATTISERVCDARLKSVFKSYSFPEDKVDKEIVKVKWKKLKVAFSGSAANPRRGRAASKESDKGPYPYTHLTMSGYQFDELNVILSYAAPAAPSSYGLPDELFEHLEMPWIMLKREIPDNDGYD